MAHLRFLAVSVWAFSTLALLMVITISHRVLAADMTGWGEYIICPPAAKNTTFEQIAAGNYHTIALTTDGRVIGWGANWKSTAVAPAELTNVTTLTAAGSYNVVVKNDGTIFAWGDGYDGTTNVPPGLGSVTSIAAGDSHVLAIRSDSTVVGWGNNNHGKATPPVGLSNVVAVSAGSYHSLALKTDGTVVGWGAGSLDGVTNFPHSGQATVPSGLSNV
ncbi:MAG: RCC1 domain-containing protein, partial [Limisphaerales bacterium]